MLKRDIVPEESGVLVHNVSVIGIEVDPQTRCKHYHDEHDVVAILFKCCKKWFPCYFCHEELSNHRIEVWQATEFRTRAIICGVCGVQMSIAEYLDCGDCCTSCGTAFNPGCRNHRHLYFAV